MQKRPEKVLAKPKEYIQSIEGGLNNVTALAKYFSSIQEIDPSVGIFYTQRKPEFQAHLDEIFKDTENSKEKLILELTGDADFIRNKNRQELYRSITENGVRMQVMMDVETWNLKNAELLKSVGVEVHHQATREHYHFGTTDSRMFSLFREPANEQSYKVVSLPQSEDSAVYWFFSTNQRDAIEFTTDLWKTFRKTATSLEERIAELSKNRKNGEMCHDILNK